MQAAILLLALLAAFFVGFLRRSKGAASPPEGAANPGTELSTLGDQVAGLRRTLDRLAASQGWGNQAAMLEKPEVDWSALHGIMDTWKWDKEAAG